MSSWREAPAKGPSSTKPDNKVLRAGGIPPSPNPIRRAKALTNCPKASSLPARAPPPRRMAFPSRDSASPINKYFTNSSLDSYPLSGASDMRFCSSAESRYSRN